MNAKAYYQRYSYNVLIAIEAIFANKIKSLLTALGIIFGVAAVISMLAIGNGAEQEILEQIKMVGVNNIIITPILPSNQATANDQKSAATSDPTQQQSATKTKFSKGLTLLDAESIKEIIPTVKDVCPVITFNYSAILNDKSSPIKLEGTTNTYFSLFDIRLESGTLFNMQHLINGYPVCIIGNNVKNVFFNQEDPVGKFIKCGQIWLKIIGVIEKRSFVGTGGGTMAVSGTDNKIIIPVKTMLLRYRNKALIRADQVEAAGSDADAGKAVATTEDRNQLDQIIVQVAETPTLTSTAKIVGKMLLRKHNDVQDFEVSIPELLLKQQQKTKNIFNIVLGAIAGISLIVGGIGIMNIMLASVLERVREIGTRQAIGASRKDIVFQFLAESTLISVSGGLIGIFLGIALSKIIQSMFDIKTIISLFSIFISFGVSVFIGIVFGYLPAKRAAEKDPVESLRQ
jgi:putative ABC transport system permease protein